MNGLLTALSGLCMVRRETMMTPATVGAAPGRGPNLSERSNMTNRTCRVDQCPKVAVSGTLCRMHANRLARNGTTDPGPKAHAPAAERLWRKVDKSGDCWLWTGYRTPFGHGQVLDDGGRMQYAHRLVWALVNGPIPEGMVVRHHCDVPACVRIDHLALGSRQDNIADMHRRRRSAKDKAGARPGYCYRDLHELTPGNRNKSGACKACDRQQAEVRKARRAAQWEAS